MKRAASLLALALSLCAPSPSARAQPAPAQDAGQSADQLFDKGRALYQSGKLQAAHDALAAAWALKQSYDIAANLGTTELELGLARDAAEHFAFCIRTFPSTGPKKNLAAVKRSFEEARSRVAALELKVSVDGAEVFVDGKSIGHAPFKDEVFVEPGTRTVEARLAGYETAKKSLQLGKGGAAQVSLEMVLAKPPPPAGPVATGKPGPDQGSGSAQSSLGARIPKRTVLIAGGAAAGAAFIGGVVFTAVANGKASAAEKLKQSIADEFGPTACAGSMPAPGCDALHQAREPQYTFSNLALWTFVGAGVLGAGTAVYALVGPRGPTKTAVQVTPIASAQGGAVLVSGAW